MPPADRPGLCLVEYFAGDFGSWVFLCRDGDEQPELRSVEVDDGALDAVLRAGDDGFDLRQVDLAALDDVVAELVAPIAELTRPDQPLCLIPHGRLHAVPFHIVQLEGEPLGLRNPVCYSPSASVLTRRMPVAPAPLARSLVIGDPGGGLVHARVEASLVGEMLASTPLVGPSAGKAAVVARLAREGTQLDLVHVAAHGHLDATDARATGVVLGPDGEGDDWHQATVLAAREIAELALRAGLVTLSCCSSGVSDLRPGGELAGLARSFLTAGAGAVVISGWAVDDFITSVLMASFYDALRVPGTSKAEALRSAARTVRGLTAAEAAARLVDVGASAGDRQAVTRKLAAAADTSSRDAVPAVTRWADDLKRLPAAARPFTHPAYWGAFSLTGDWRPFAPPDSGEG